MMLDNNTKIKHIITIIISFTILLSNNISFLSSYSQNTTTAKTETTNSLNLSKIPTKIIKVGDIDIGYKQNGTGPPILLITGFSASMNNWNLTLVSNLSKNHNVTNV